jgi:hypothetical protein
LSVHSVTQIPGEIIPNSKKNGNVLIGKKVSNNFIRNVFMPIKEYLDIGTSCGA